METYEALCRILILCCYFRCFQNSNLHCNRRNRILIELSNKIYYLHFKFQDSVNTQHRKELMNMQKHSAFARIEARDISPAAPPSTPGSETKKSRRPMTARSNAKSGIPTPTTPQKTPNSPNSKLAGDSGKNSPAVTPEVSTLKSCQISCKLLKKNN